MEWDKYPKLSFFTISEFCVNSHTKWIRIWIYLHFSAATFHDKCNLTEHMHLYSLPTNVGLDYARQESSLFDIEMELQVFRCEPIQKIEYETDGDDKYLRIGLTCLTYSTNVVLASVSIPNAFVKGYFLIPYCVKTLSSGDVYQIKPP